MVNLKLSLMYELLHLLIALLYLCLLRTDYIQELSSSKMARYHLEHQPNISVEAINLTQMQRQLESVGSGIIKWSTQSHSTVF